MEPRSWKEVLAGGGLGETELGETELARRRQRRDASTEDQAVRYLVKHYGLQDRVPSLRNLTRERNGEDRLVLADFVRTFNYPVWWTARRVLGLMDLTVSLLLRASNPRPLTQHMLVRSWEEAKESADGTGRAPGLLFPWPGQGWAVLHDLELRRAAAGNFFRRSGGGLQFTLMLAPAFFAALEWQP